MWTCPACQQGLIKQSGQWQCSNRHTYDIGKEGYVNLLLVNQKRSKEPGDNKQMVNARRAFLSADYYKPLSDTLCQVLTSHLSHSSPVVLDAGCGEGYYLNQLEQALLEEGKTPRCLASDISKIAVQKGAKKYPGLEFAVASSFNLPLEAQSLHAVVQVFAPVSIQEIMRCLKPGGLWLQVNPAQEHLNQLKQALYQTPEGYSAPELPDGFSCIHSERVSFDIELAERQQRHNLLMMTPFYWSVADGELDNVIDKMANIRADFEVRLLAMDKES